MIYLFISDLHLSAEHPRLVRGFLDLLREYQHKNTQLYILGDWFNAWVGDDYHATWLDDIVKQLQQFSQAGNQIFFQVGNRDFALGQQFLDQFQGQRLPDEYHLHIAHKVFRLEHGDALCTDDLHYQRFKKIIRHPLVLGTLLRLPLRLRQKIALGFRQQSHAAQQQKSYVVMDVNAHAVTHALSHVDILVHGHTHRPDIHHEADKIRIVLGDWRENTSEAMILEVNEQAEWQLIKWEIA